MNSIQETPQEFNSMDSTDSNTQQTSSTTTEYAYRPLITKHRRAGSTGTTGDEEYTTDDDDELYNDDIDCSNPTTTNFSILKSDLARAATDLFGYKNDDNSKVNNQPTGLFDDDDKKFSSTKPNLYFSLNENTLLSHNVTTNKRRSSGSNSSLTTNKDIKKKSLTDTTTTTTSIPNIKLDTKKSLDNRLLKKLNNEEKLMNENCHKNSDENDDDTRKLTHNNDDITQRNSSSNNTNLTNPESSNTEKINDVNDDDLSDELIIIKLREELNLLKTELKLKDEEVIRLLRIRQDVEAELQELTASLFQEAHNMVQEANLRRASAERLLEESRMKSEMLAAEVMALKTLVLTSTPARPNPHLHPQIANGCTASHSDENGSNKSKYRRSPSHFNLKYGRESSPPDSPQKNSPRSTTAPLNGSTFFDNHQQNQNHSCNHHENDRDKETRDRDNCCKRLMEKDSRSDNNKETVDNLDGLEVDPRVHAEFLNWKLKPSVDKTDPFIERIFREDIDLCLDFPNIELGDKVRQAVLDGIIFVEAVSDKAKLGFPKKCALLNTSRHCQYRIRISDQDNQWHCISQLCRNRIIAVCDFLNYLRYIERGLVKSSVNDIFWEIIRLRKEMVLARLGMAVSA